MASIKRSEICLALLVLTIAHTWGGARGQSSTSCTSVLISMSSCLNYITGNSSMPTSSCCSALSNVVQSQPQCLCSVLNGGVASSLGVAINQTRALEIPGACKIQTPAASKCNGGGGGSPTSATAPADSPSGVPDDEPEAPAGDLPSGSKTIPSTQGSTSNGSITKSPLHLLAFIFSVVSCTSVVALL